MAQPPSKRVVFSLQWKLAIFAVIAVMIILIAGNFLFVAPTRLLLEGALLEQGRALARNLAYNVYFGVLTEDATELKKNSQGVVEEPAILYVLIFNKEGKEILPLPKDEVGQKALETARKLGVAQNKGDTDSAPRVLTIEGTDSRQTFYDLVSPVRKSDSAASSSGVGALEEAKPAPAGEAPVIGYVHLGVALSEITARENQFKNHLFLMAALIAVPGIGAYLFLWRIVLTPLTRMAGMADNIAGGDLTQRVDLKSGDEIGLLAQSFNQMLEGLRALARELKGAGGQLSRSAQEILTAAEEQSASSREQSVSVNETTATMEELAQTSKQIAENSDRVARTAEETFHTAQAGAKAVEDTIAGMMSIKSQTESNTNKIFALGDKIQKIGNVVKIINDIADQTKLIAFNAAIEAAGAGEAGKRFSIVAVEVRRLADTVVESIEEIKNTITEIQLATNELILSSEKGIKDVEEGVNVASRGGEALQKIIAMIKHTTESSKQISLSTQQQRTASEQVVISMKEVSKTANQTASSSKQTIAIATELNSLSEQLATVVKRFDLGNGDAEAARAAASAAPREPMAVRRSRGSQN